MTRLDIDIEGKWHIIVFYNVQMPELNQGFTYSDLSKHMSIMSIGVADSRKQFINTIVHEAKHVQSAICYCYDVKEDSEDAAYLIGYIVMKMSSCF